MVMLMLMGILSSQSYKMYVYLICSNIIIYVDSSRFIRGRTVIKRR